MSIQNVQNVYDLQWSNSAKYGDLFLLQERECSKFNFELADEKFLFSEFKQYETECNRLLQQNIVIPAYEYCIKASHTFNLLEARGVISTAERYNYVLKIRELSAKCAKKYMENLIQKTSDNLEKNKQHTHHKVENGVSK
jgi:glycyl-tRNA synthetase alpha chain